PAIKSVVAVDLYGQCADYDAIRGLCSARKLLLLQDAAESLGSTYKGKPAGGQGDMAIFSFNGNKVITTSGGGMLVSHDEDWVEHARKLSTQAREPEPHYEHTEIGFNYRLSNLLAAVRAAQLAALPERLRAHRGRAGADRRDRACCLGFRWLAGRDVLDPVGPALGPAADGVRIDPLQLERDRADADLVVVNRPERGDLGGGAGHEDLV